MVLVKLIVQGFQDIEPSLLTKDKKTHHYQSGLLYSIKPTGDIELDALKNYLRVNLVLSYIIHFYLGKLKIY